MEETKEATPKENNIKPFKTVNLSEVAHGKLSAAAARTEAAEKLLLEERRSQADILDLIYDQHNIDPAKVIKVHLEENRLIIYDG